jgi:hypothetical protein
MAQKAKGSNLDAYNEQFRYNKIAFDDVIGDPFAKPEPIDGQFFTLSRRSTINVMDNNFDLGKGTRNAAQPSVIDFFCDVERAITDTLDEEGAQKFRDTYVTGDKEDALTPKERMQIEQKLGKLFRNRKLSPVTKYFKTIRQSVGSIRAKERAQGRLSL